MFTKIQITIYKGDVKFMDKEKKTQINEEKEESYMAIGMSLGMCFGVTGGVVVGSLVKNIGTCIGIGMCIGMLLGMAIGSAIKKDNSNNVK